MAVPASRSDLAKGWGLVGAGISWIHQETPTSATAPAHLKYERGANQSISQDGHRTLGEVRGGDRHYSRPTGIFPNSRRPGGGGYLEEAFCLSEDAAPDFPDLLAESVVLSLEGEESCPLALRLAGLGLRESVT